MQPATQKAAKVHLLNQKNSKLTKTTCLPGGIVHK